MDATAEFKEEIIKEQAHRNRGILRKYYFDKISTILIPVYFLALGFLFFLYEYGIFDIDKITNSIIIFLDTRTSSAFTNVIDVIQEKHNLLIFSLFGAFIAVAFGMAYIIKHSFRPSAFGMKSPIIRKKKDAEEWDRSEQEEWDRSEQHEILNERIEKSQKDNIKYLFIISDSGTGKSVIFDNY